MKFSVRSAELQKALAKTVSVVPTRSTLPILENLHFDVHANTLKITATDLEISVSVSLEVQGSQNGTIAIPAKRIFDTVRALSDTNVTFNIDTESNKIKMKTDNGEYTLTGESSEEFPAIPEFKGETEVAFDVQVLQRLIGTTMFAVSADELRPAMMGVLFQFSKSEVRAIFSKIKVETGKPIPLAHVTCTGSLWAISDETGQRVNIDSWYGEVHHVTFDHGAWHLAGTFWEIPRGKESRPAFLPHPFF